LRLVLRSGNSARFFAGPVKEISFNKQILSQMGPEWNLWVLQEPFPPVKIITRFVLLLSLSQCAGTEQAA
jgi:hypothetical protein